MVNYIVHNCWFYHLMSVRFYVSEGETHPQFWAWHEPVSDPEFTPLSSCPPSDLCPCASIDHCQPQLTFSFPPIDTNSLSWTDLIHFCSDHTLALFSDLSLIVHVHTQHASWTELSQCLSQGSTMVYMHKLELVILFFLQPILILSTSLLHSMTQLCGKDSISFCTSTC